MIPEITLAKCNECPREFCGTTRETRYNLSRHIKANHPHCKCISDGMFHGCSDCKIDSRKDDHRKDGSSFHLGDEDFKDGGQTFK